MTSVLHTLLASPIQFIWSVQLLRQPTPTLPGRYILRESSLCHHPRRRLEDSTKMMENCQLLFLLNSFELDAPLLNVLPFLSFPSRIHCHPHVIHLLFTFYGWLKHSPMEMKIRELGEFSEHLVSTLSPPNGSICWLAGQSPDCAVQRSVSEINSKNKLGA